MTGSRLLKSAAFAAAYFAAAFAVAAGGAASSGGMRLGWEFCIAQGKVPKLETAKRLVDIAGKLGYDQIQLFSKAAFRYEKHPEASFERSPYTWKDVKELEEYCLSKGIELVPYQALFSHMEPYLAVPRLNALAEAPDAGVKARWGVTKYPMGLCPVDPRSIRLVDDILDELLPNFRSSYVNTGCDEFIEFDDGGVRSAAAVKERGALEVYVDFIRKMESSVRRRGKTMMCWADVVLKHPEAVKSVPKDVVLLNWGYGAKHPFDAQCSVLAKSGHRFWVCPGTSGWNSLVGCVGNMKANVSAAYAAGVKHGADGLLLTTWGDGGHPQPWIVELPGLVYAAALVREGKTLSDEELARRIDGICGCRCGETLLRYGELYRLSGGAWLNASALCTILRTRGAISRFPRGVTKESLEKVFAERRAAESRLCLDGAEDWVREDFELMGLLLDAVECRVRGDDGRVVGEISERYARLWLKQNRPGGLEGSIELNLMQSKDWARTKKWN